MTRIESAQLMVFAGYHGDTETAKWIIALCRPDVNLWRCWQLGRQSKAAGVVCTCSECNEQTGLQREPKSKSYSN